LAFSIVRCDAEFGSLSGHIGYRVAIKLDFMGYKPWSFQRRDGSRLNPRPAQFSLESDLPEIRPPADRLFPGHFLDLIFMRCLVVADLRYSLYLSLLSQTTRVILCSGNHDLDERSSEGEKIARWIGEVRELGIACDGDSLTIGDIGFTVCPWWDGPLVKSRIEAQLRTAAAARAPRWIWVHHAPPANSPTSWGGKRFFGDVELVQWIAQYQPSMVISGHVHQSPFISDGSWFDRLGPTWVFNAGLQPGRPPVYIVLDLNEGTAFWLPAGEAHYIDLKTPLQRPAAPVTIVPAWLKSLGRIADPSLAKPASAAG